MNSLQTTNKLSFLAALLLLMTGCAGLLPRNESATLTPWPSYAEGQAMFAKIIPGRTRHAELVELGIDPDRSPNVALLGNADLLRRLVATSSFDITQDDPALRACVTARHSCFAYQIEQSFLERKRVGNFWADFFNFRRQIAVSGWQFDAIIVIKDGIVIYKLWSGKPNIRQAEDESNPLGPLQGIGPSIFAR